MQEIPFNRPTLVGTELNYLAQAIQMGCSAGDAEFTKKCHDLLERILGVPKVLLTTSCTTALDMAALLLEIKAGDEVIVPSFTFVSTANAFVMRGAKPVFIDCRQDTLNMDETQLTLLINERTKAVVPVHYAGVGCEMDAICEIANSHNIAVIEDNAHGLFGQYKGRFLGTFGIFGTQSFHETKNFVCGEGGAILVNDVKYIERAEIVREKGTNRSRFFRGQIDKYSWVDVGSSYLLSDMLASFLLAQLEARDEIQGRRRRIWEYYYKNLQLWANNHGVRLPIVPAHCDQAYHMFYMIMPSLEARQALIAHLKGLGIVSTFHYLPLHLSDMGRKYGGKKGDCPVTESVSDCLIRLPFYHDLTEHDQSRVVATIKTFEYSSG